MYQIYQNPQTEHIVAVKNNFQWLACLAPSYWAWMMGLTGLGWIHLAITIFLGWTGIVYVIQMIFQGVKAGEHHGEYLVRHGYVAKDGVMAFNEFDAIDRYVKQQKGIES